MLARYMLQKFNKSITCNVRALPLGTIMEIVVHMQWTSRDPYAGQGSKPFTFFQFTTRLGRHI